MGKVGNFFKNKIVLNCMAALVVVFVLIVASYWFFALVTRHGKELVVPDVTLMSVDLAEKVLEKSEMQLEVLDSVYVRSLPRGVVYLQNPAPGSHVKKGRTVRVMMNAIVPKMVAMPDLVGYSLRQANDVIVSKGLVPGRLTYVPDIATDNVLRQTCKGRTVVAGELLESGSVIDLVLGLDESDNTTFIPDVLGLNISSAMDVMYGNSLNIGAVRFDNTVRTYSDSTKAVVYKQNPTFSELPVSMGTDVTLYMTMDKSKVPSVPVTTSVKKQ